MAKDQMQTAPPPIEMIAHMYQLLELQASESIPEEGLEAFNFNYNPMISTVAEENQSDNKLFRVKLTVASDESEDVHPYSFRIEVMGYFRMLDDNTDKWNGHIHILAPSMLYGAVREFLFGLTQRGPYPGVYLPTISFIPIESTEKKT